MLEMCLRGGYACLGGQAHPVEGGSERWRKSVAWETVFVLSRSRDKSFAPWVGAATNGMMECSGHWFGRIKESFFQHDDESWLGDVWGSATGKDWAKKVLNKLHHFPRVTPCTSATFDIVYIYFVFLYLVSMLVCVCVWSDCEVW